MTYQTLLQNMLKKALDKSPDVHQIDLDVNRTFRNTTYFRERYNDRQKALLHVLAAYSMYNTEIGYCQVMIIQFYWLTCSEVTPSIHSNVHIPIAHWPPLI